MPGEQPIGLTPGGGDPNAEIVQIGSSYYYRTLGYSLQTLPDGQFTVPGFIANNNTNMTWNRMRTSREIEIYTPPEPDVFPNYWYPPGYIVPPLTPGVTPTVPSGVPTPVLVPPPVHQPNVAPQVNPVPVPRTTPRPNYRPNRGVNPRLRPRMLIEIPPYGNPRITTENVPSGRPPRGTRERKRRSQALQGLAYLLEALTEGMDLLEILAGAAGIESDDPRQQAIELFWEGKISDLDFEEFIKGLAYNEIEDLLAGKGNAKLRDAFNNLNQTHQQLPTWFAGLI